MSTRRERRIRRAIRACEIADRACSMELESLARWMLDGGHADAVKLIVRYAEQAGRTSMSLQRVLAELSAIATA